MKTTCSILITLFFGFTIFAQTPQTIDDLKKEVKTFKDTNNKRYVIRYDKFTDKSNVAYLGDVLNSGLSYAMSGTMMQLTVGFEFNGDSLKENPDTFVLYFYSTGKSWEFLKDQNLYALADGERFDLGRGGYDGEINKTLFSGYKTDETLAFKISREQLEKFTKAKSFEVKIANREFKIKENTQKGFNNLLALGTL